jgi:vacuolar-type H+-ATPase subunit E/Vma4
MGDSRRKLWTRSAHGAPADDLQEQASGESEVEEHLVAVEAEGGATAPLAAEVPAEVEPDSAADRSAGEEVDVILETARAAAAKIRGSAADEAQQVRADADAHAQNARADADAYAGHVRGEAEREAEEILAAARARLESADSEVNEKMRHAEEQVQRRTESLRAESKRHEERLQRIVVVFRGMTSQLEELLENPAAGEQGDARAPNEQVDEALEAESARSGVVA